MSKITDDFASMVFHDRIMKEKLPKDIYQNLQRAMHQKERLDEDSANVIATAMKNWAIEKGATHYTHWFQPMTGVTAEKHNSFLSPVHHDQVIMEFDGKELIQGESDASSFPSGGLRATFEARGYTAWDPTSYVFIKDHVLCIPTIFCSHKGESLDKKTPLLKAEAAIQKQVQRILKLFHIKAQHIQTMVGAEQEYFLIDKTLFHKREDLRFCGRTLFGCKPMKTQELDDHYYGVLKPRVKDFMKEVNEELWKLGILAKTQHNEVAPSQHELAPIHMISNIASDQNQLIMEILQKIADKHHFVCLLHEKPFEGFNGSGKHNNWSISTEDGKNLFSPGDTPSENAQFLLFLCAVIKAVDEHQDLLRLSVASAGNDHRLGAQEAPPAIMSIFIGEELYAILDAIEKDIPYQNQTKKAMEIGIENLPVFLQDTTDRNRTSPFAFTGNKFEFRMLGSSQSIASVNTILNTIVADALDSFATILENADDFQLELHQLIKATIRQHRRIIYNGDNYSEHWKKEAKERGLLQLSTTPDALQYYISKKNIHLFEKHQIFHVNELFSRHEMLLKKYGNVLHIEAKTMLYMIKSNILPTLLQYQKELASTCNIKKEVHKKINIDVEKNLLLSLSDISQKIFTQCEQLTKQLDEANSLTNSQERAHFYCTHMKQSMSHLREWIDYTEQQVPSSIWPYPTYKDLLFSE